MAILIKTVRVLAAMAVVGMLLSGGKDKIGVNSQCQGDIEHLIAHCAPYVRKGSPREDPSPACCNDVSTTDVGCLCQHLTEEAERAVDMDKVVHVAAVCGKPLPHDPYDETILYSFRVLTAAAIRYPVCIAFNEAGE